MRSTSSALCLPYACTRSHAFVQDSGFVSHAEKHNRSGHGVVVSKVSYGILEYAFYHLPGRLLKCVEIEQQWVGSVAASLSATRVRKM